MQGRSFDNKYRQAYRTLADNPAIVAKIKETAKLYGIDPIHMVGAIVGEHTFNISAIMSMQNYYVKALGYASSRVARVPKRRRKRCATLRPARIRWLLGDANQLRAVGLPPDHME